MPILLLGLFLFITAHSLSFFAPGSRVKIRSLAGETRWKGFVSVVSLIGLGLIGYGYGLARQEPIPFYEPEPWARYLSLLIMVPVFPLLFATYLPGRIQRAIAHPTLTAVTLWAFAHLLANGNLADVVLFWSFFIWSIADRLGLKYRPAAVAAPVPGAPPRPANDPIAVGAGLAVYAVFLLWAHVWLIGGDPLAVPEPVVQPEATEPVAPPEAAEPGAPPAVPAPAY